MPSRARLATLVPILVLVAAPILGASINSSTYTEVWYNQVVFEIQSTNIPGFGLFTIIVMDVVLIVLSMAYGLFPNLYNKIGLLKKHAEHTTKEYRIIMKILRIEIPLLVLLTFYYFLFWVTDIEPYYSLAVEMRSNYLFFYYFLISLFYFILYSVVGGLLWIASNKINKEFYFYLAKGCFENILEKNEIGKIQSMIRGLRYYNQYLQKVLNLRINNVDGVTSKILSDSKVDKHKAIESIYHAFEGNDTFQPITCISTTLGILETEKFLVKQPVVEKIKDWTTYIIATIIPFIVSIIQFLFPASQTQPPG